MQLTTPADLRVEARGCICGAMGCGGGAWPACASVPHDALRCCSLNRRCLPLAQAHSMHQPACIAEGQALSSALAWSARARQQGVRD